METLEADFFGESNTWAQFHSNAGIVQCDVEIFQEFAVFSLRDKLPFGFGDKKQKVRACSHFIRLVRTRDQIPTLIGC